MPPNTAPPCGIFDVQLTLRQAQGRLWVRAAFLGIFVAWSWFRQTSVVSSRPPLARFVEFSSKSSDQELCFHHEPEFTKS